MACNNCGQDPCGCVDPANPAVDVFVPGGPGGLGQTGGLQAGTTVDAGQGAICAGCGQSPCTCSGGGVAFGVDRQATGVSSDVGHTGIIEERCGEPSCDEVALGGQRPFHHRQHIPQHRHPSSHHFPVGVPYYAAARVCAEDNRETVREIYKSQVYKNAYEFSMPDCGQSISVVFEDVLDIAVGAYFWNQQLGWLEISGFNPTVCQIELRNPCVVGCGDNAPPGTVVGAYTNFILTAPPCPGAFGGSNDFPFLNSGFVAPADGSCVEVAVTNVNGLVTGKSVSLNGGIYNLADVLSDSLIQICNEGLGLTPGTTVDYKDTGGNLVVPIILVDTNPCTNTPVLTGVPLVCVGGVTYPLIGTQNGQILVYDSVSGKSNFRTLGIPTLNCTELTVGFTIDPSNDPAFAYLIAVVDPTIFEENELITIGSTQFIITEILDVTHMHIVPVFAPGAIQNYTAGSNVCSADCCTTLDVRVARIENNVDVAACQKQASSANFANSVPIAFTDISSIDPTLDGNIALLTIVNPSCTLPMGILINWHFEFVYDLVGVDDDVQDVGRFCEIAFDPSDVAALTVLFDLPETHIFQTVPTGTAGINRHSSVASYSKSDVIPPGETRSIQGRATMAFNAGNATKVTVKTLACMLSYIAVAIQN